MGFRLLATLLFFGVSTFSSVGMSEHAVDPKGVHEERKPRPEAQESKMNAEDLRVYLALVSARKAHLEAANAAIMKNVDYAYWQVGALVFKGALDGYLTGLLFKGVGAVFLPKGWTSEAVKGWVVAGGLQKLKAAGFDVGVLGLSAIANEVLAEESSWLYRIPIFGSAKVAYDWSTKFFSAPERLEENGRQIVQLMREKFRIERALKALDADR